MVRNSQVRPSIKSAGRTESKLYGQTHMTIQKITTVQVRRTWSQLRKKLWVVNCIYSKFNAIGMSSYGYSHVLENYSIWLFSGPI